MDNDVTAPDYFDADKRCHVETDYEAQKNLLTEEIGITDVQPIPFNGSGPD